MTLAEIPEVVIDPGRGYKFIVVKLIDTSGTEKLVVRAKEQNRSIEYHADILDELKREMHPWNIMARCIGCGYIFFDSVNKIIRVYSRSGEFGREPDRPLTVTMIKNAFSDFQVAAD